MNHSDALLCRRLPCDSERYQQDNKQSELRHVLSMTSSLSEPFEKESDGEDEQNDQTTHADENVENTDGIRSFSKGNRQG